METPNEVVTEPSISDLRTMLSGGEPVKVVPAESALAETKTDPDPEPDATQKRDEAGKFKAEEAEEDKIPVSPNVQKRIDKAVKAQREAERKLADAEAKLTPQESRPAQETAPSVATPTKPKPQIEQFESYEDYIEAIADWKADERDAKREQQAAVKQHAETMQMRVAKAKEEFADFEEVVTEAAKTLPISQAMTDYIMQSENGPKVAYKLAKDPAEVARIRALSPIAAIRELSKIEDSLTAPAAPATKTLAAAKPLPKPPAAIGGGASPTAIDLSDPKLPMAAFKREFQKRLIKK